MLLKELLEKAEEEVIEPETIRRLLPELTEEEFNTLEAMITIKTSNYPFEDFYAFENVIRALNGFIPDITMIEGAEPKWIWYACEIFKKLRPNMKFSHEVFEYIRSIYADRGIYILHPYVTDTGLHQQLYIAAKHKSENGPFPIEPNSLINRQAIELMKMTLYTSKTMENK